MPYDDAPPPLILGPLPLSVAIVCKDNQRTIARTLESVAGLVSEIVAVDSGSTDGTIALLEKHGARVIKSEWLGHVKTKQMALDACSKPWTLCLDSDESLEPDLSAAIRRAISREDVAVGGYRVNRKIWYREKPLDHAWQPEPRLRMVRKGMGRWGGPDPHDALELAEYPGGPGWVRDLEGTLRHDSFETFTDHLRKQWEHSRTMARSLHERGERGSYWRLVCSPPGAMFKQLVLKRGFKDGYPGWLAAASSGAGALMKHAMLIELCNSRRP